MAQDVGPKFPGATPVFTAPEVGRALVDYTPGLGRGNTVQTEQVTQDVDDQFKLYRLDAVGDDEYTATPSDGATTLGPSIRIAKPWQHRKSVFDGQTINGRTYTYITDDERLVATDTDVVHQTIQPPYDIGVELLQAGVAANTGLTGGVKLFDVNTAGRRWVTTGPLVRYQIQSVADDHLVCLLLLPNGSTAGTSVKVLKPWALRRTPFDNLTVDGVAYTYQSAARRTADGSDVYLITPNYWQGAEILAYRQNGLVNVGTLEDTNLVDVNVDARAWALDPEA